MNLVQAALDKHDFGWARRLLVRHLPSHGTADRRAWEWRYLWQQCRSDALFTLTKQSNTIWALVISLGGSFHPDALAEFPKGPLIFQTVPQLDLIARARLVITHAGLNTVLESLTHGVPLIGIPITNDQPGVGARLAWSGVGEVIPLRRLTRSRLRTAVQRVLFSPIYAENSVRLRKAISRAGGATRAADIIENCAAVHSGVACRKSRRN
jgi:MGT family glycosyltransferase